MAFIIGATIIGAGVGILGQQSSSRAADRATEASQEGFNQYKPYVDANLAGSKGALEGQLETGAYDGIHHARQNDIQTNTVNTMADRGGRLMDSGYNMMDANGNFGSNYQDMYDQSQGLYGNNSALANQFQGLSESAKADRLGVANEYAANNSGALVDAAMRGETRNLHENTLTGIDMNSSGTGNTNSSRSAVAGAVANRAYDDRRADVTMATQDRLVDRSLDSQARQFSDQSGALTNAGNAYNSMGNNLRGSGMMNEGIQGSYDEGLNTLGQGANFSMNAGNTKQGFDQDVYDTRRSDFERKRDFEMRKRQEYQSGILGKAPTSPMVMPNYNNPYTAGAGGAMQGFGFATSYKNKTGIFEENGT